MRVSYILAAVLAAALLTSCATVQPPEPVYIPKTKVLEIPSEFTTAVEVPAPHFTVEEFVKMAPDQREDAMFKYNSVLLGVLGTNNIKTKKLADWERRQRILYQSEFDSPIVEATPSLSIR